MWSRIQRYFARIPLIGPLVDCRLRDHVETIGQTFVVLLLSTAPLWLGALVIHGTTQDAVHSFRQAFFGTIANGELFMYSTALLAPIIWVALVDLPGGARFSQQIGPYRVDSCH